MTILNNLVPFTTIEALARDRHGGAASLAAKMPVLKDTKSLARIPDHRWLSDMTKRVFQAGFNWTVIEKKWPDFEDAFEGFEPRRWHMMSDADIDRLLADARIVRNGAKIAAVQVNATLLCQLADQYGAASRAFSNWPPEDFVGLLTMLQKRGSRLGGATAQWLMRSMGKDGFVLTSDVTEALIREGVVNKPPTSQRDLKAVQAAFNIWRNQSGLPLAYISRTLACTVESTPRRKDSPLSANKENTHGNSDRNRAAQP